MLILYVSFPITFEDRFNLFFLSPMETQAIYAEGDEVIPLNASNPMPMIIRQVDQNSFGKVIYKCSWQYYGGQIGNTIYKEEELCLVKKVGLG